MKNLKLLIKNNGGFVSAHWDGTTETEEKIKRETKATIRCIPLNNSKEDGKCIYSNNAFQLIESYLLKPIDFMS